MTNLSRITAKIFGETATTTGDDPEIGQFGSALAGTYVGTADVATIQSLPAWSNGFIDSVTPSTQFPPLPEVTGFGKVLSYQNAYLLQKGIAEWDSTTVYYTTSYCQHNGGIYRSKVNDNIGNIPLANTSNDYWQFLGKDFLNTQQVTNCLLEVPQNIKLELNNGTLTLKAGSKVIVPNGFEQDGVTPKFDEVTIENDIVRSYTSNSAQTGFVHVNINDQTNLPYTAYSCSGSTDTITGRNHLWYDTTNNLLKMVDGSNVVTGNTAFPLGRITLVGDGTASVSSINQVFNGFGYIGSTIWADKGIKCLIPNGRNADGSLNNIEHTLSKLSIRNVTSNGNKTLHINGNYPGFSDMLGLTNSKLLYYDAEKNYNCHVENNTIVTYQDSICGSISVESGVITSFTVQNALNLNAMCDGQWVNSDLELAAGTTYPTTNDITYDISSYLPNDGYDYEVMLTGYVTTGATSGNYLHMDIYTDVLTSFVRVCAAQTRTNAGVVSAGSAVVPVSTGRIIKVFAYSNYKGTFNLSIVAYRRLGTNA